MSKLLDNLVACGSQLAAPLSEIYPRYFPIDAGRRFVEVGAFDGYQWSNTWPLVQQGWAGLLFEPFREYYEMCIERYRDNPLIEVEQCALAEACGSVKLFPAGSMTTIAENMIDIWNRIDWVGALGLSHNNFTMCEAHTLNCQLAQHNMPIDFDLLVIDAEGADDRVLMGLDLNHWHPSMIIIELDVNSQEPVITAKVEWIKLHLQFSGYQMIHSDAINTIYWRDK